MRNPLQSLSLRLLAAFLLPTLVFLLLAGTAGYALARAALEEELGASLASLAAAAASGVSGERMLAIAPGDDLPGAQTRTWRNLSRSLEALREASGARRVFAVDVEGRVRADAGGGLPVGAELPELARDRLELARVRAGARSASQVLFAGADGQLYKTGYAPVRQGSEVVGVVGVEGSAAFFGPLHQLARAFALLASVALAVLAALALLTARGLGRPLRRLMAAAERIAGGDLATPVHPEPLREVGVLARELERMRGALEARDRQMQLMLAGVAHEVRNPLGGIALYAGLLREDLAAPAAGGAAPGAHPEALGHVARIQQEIDYLQRIVEDFLAFAREQPVQRAPLGAPDLVEGAVALLGPEAQARGVRLEVQVEEAVLEADGSLLLAALVNLVKNAVQASEAGGSVRVEGVRDGARYLVRVADAGSGVPEAVQARIFEPFFTTRQKGSGLGLALARKVVQAHGGELSFRSRPGDTVFTLALPLARRA